MARIKRKNKLRGDLLHCYIVSIYGCMMMAKDLERSQKLLGENAVTARREYAKSILLLLREIRMIDYNIYVEIVKRNKSDIKEAVKVYRESKAEA